MEHENDQRVRERAYFLWEKEGCPEGQAELYWQRAQLIEQQEDKPPIVTPLQTAIEQNEVDQALEETFPASDPPSFVPGSTTRASGG